jgi:zinc protease
MRPAIACGTFAIGVGLAAAGAWAQPYEQPPLPGPAPVLQVATPSEARLPNGLRVIVAERHGVPLVSAHLIVLGGSETDPPQRAGLASLTAGLLTRGTRTHGASALVGAAEALGGSLDSGAGWNQSGIGIMVTTPRLSEALSLVAEVAMQPAFAQAEVDRLRREMLDELKVAYSQPGTLASLTAQRALFGAGGYGHPAGGTPRSLPRIQRDDVLRLHAALYRPDNAVLVLAGDIDAEGALSLARRHFGAWKAPQAALSRGERTRGTPWPEGITVIDMPGAGQAGVALVMPGVASNAPDRHAGAVANAVLGGGYSSRLNLEVRIKRGLTYSVASQLDARRDAGVLRVGAQTKNPSAAEVLGLMNAEVDRMMSEPVPGEELEARKARLVGAFGRSLETTSGLSANIAALVVAGLPLSELPKRIERLNAVGPAEVQAFASAHFARDGRRAVVAGVASEFDAALKGIAPKVITVPQGTLDLESGEAPR